MVWVGGIRLPLRACGYGSERFELCIAFVFAIGIVNNFAGVQRVGVGGNPIVFANAVLALLVLVVYCRPQERTFVCCCRFSIMLMFGVPAIVLSGSRGAVPGFGLVVLVAMIGSHGDEIWGFAAWSSLGCIGVVLALTLTVPWLASRTRLENIQSELQEYAAAMSTPPSGQDRIPQAGLACTP